MFLKQWFKLSNFSIETNLAQTTVCEVGITQERVISLQELISDYQAYASLSKQRIVLALCIKYCNTLFCGSFPTFKFTRLTAYLFLSILLIIAMQTSGISHQMNSNVLTVLSVIQFFNRLDSRA